MNQKKNFKTTTGGYFTLLTVIICIICSIGIGEDFLLKKNPTIYSEIISEKTDILHKINKDELLIAWRLEDKHGNILSGELPFFPKAKFNKYQNISNTFTRVGYKTLKSFKCSDYFKEKDFNLPLKNKEEWNCIDTSELTMGGYWGKDFLQYFDFTLDSCQEVSEDVYENCVEYGKLRDFFKDEVYISFYYGKVFNQNENPEEALNVEFYNFFRKLDLKLSLYDICMFSYVNIKDDIGVFLPVIKESKKMTFQSCNPNYSTNVMENYLDNKNNKIYWVEYYLDNSYIQNHRRFLKISSFLSALGGFFNITFIILAFVYRPFNSFLKNQYLLNYFFKYEEEDNEVFKQRYIEFKNVNREYIKRKKRKKSNTNENENNQKRDFGKLKEKEEDKNKKIEKINLSKGMQLSKRESKLKLDDSNLKLSILAIQENPIDKEKEKILPKSEKLKDLKENSQKIPTELLNLKKENSNIDNSNRKLDEIKDSNEEKYNPNNIFNFKEIIDRTKISYKTPSKIPYYLKCFRKKSDKHFYQSLNNAIFQINKKLELTRYIKNLNLLRIIGKITLNDQERFYFKNYFRENVDIKGVYNSAQKDKRIKEKQKDLMEYINEQSKEDFSINKKPSKMIFSNIFNYYNEND